MTDQLANRLSPRLTEIIDNPFSDKEVIEMAKKLRGATDSNRFRIYRLAIAVTSLLVLIEAIGAPRKF